MWKKIIEHKYLTIIKYYFLGIILAVLAFQLMTGSMRNHALDISILIGMETLKYIFSSLVGGLFSGYIFMLFALKRTDRQIQEQGLWQNLKDNRTRFFIQNIIAFTIGGFAYKIVYNLFDLVDFNKLPKALFTSDFIVDYLGFAMATTVFSISLSIGIKKRLDLLFDK